MKSPLQVLTGLLTLALLAPLACTSAKSPDDFVHFKYKVTAFFPERQ